MNVAAAGVAGAVAGVATMVSILGHAVPGVAVPAAVCALAAAAVSIVEAVRPSSLALSAPPVDELEGVGRVRTAFRSEQLGREDLVRILDQIERTALNPTLPLRDPDYLRYWAAVPETEFRRYLVDRMDALERAS